MLSYRVPNIGDDQESSHVLRDSNGGRLRKMIRLGTTIVFCIIYTPGFYTKDSVGFDKFIQKELNLSFQTMRNRIYYMFKKY